MHNEKIIVTCKLEKNKNISIKENLCKSLSKKLKLPLAVVDIASAEPFGNMENKYIIKVPNFTVKTMLFRAVKLTKPKDLFLNEFLIKARQNLFFELRQMRKNGELYSVYSFNGQLFVKYSLDGPSFRVKSLNDIMNPNARNFEHDSSNHGDNVNE